MDQTKRTFPDVSPDLLGEFWKNATNEEVDNMTYQDMADLLEKRILPIDRELIKNPNSWAPRPHTLKMYETLLILLKKELKERIDMNPESKLVDLMTNYINQTDVRTFMELVLKAIESSDEYVNKSKKDESHDN